MKVRNRSHYSQNLLAQHRHLHQVAILALIPILALTLGFVGWSFYQFRQASAFTYVFHTGGASIQIYEPVGQLSDELQLVRRKLNNAALPEIRARLAPTTGVPGPLPVRPTVP